MTIALEKRERRKVKSTKRNDNFLTKIVVSFLEAPPRLGLGNRGFAVRCLTTWLWRHMTKPDNEIRFCFLWSGLRGSNSLPPPWQGGALPDELKPQNGASGQSRTGDTRIFSPLLYLLSYRGKYKTVVGTTGLEPVTPCL